MNRIDYTPMYRHSVPSVRKWTRAQWRELREPPYRRLRVNAADPLSLREYVLRTEGRETLHNWIRG